MSQPIKTVDVVLHVDIDVVFIVVDVFVVVDPRNLPLKSWVQYWVQYWGSKLGSILGFDIGINIWVQYWAYILG